MGYASIAHFFFFKNKKTMLSIAQSRTALFAELTINYSYYQPPAQRINIKTSRDAYVALLPYYEDIIEHRERGVALLLNRANQVIGVYNMGDGGITGTVIDTRLLLCAAINCLASSIILSHNHPSGNLKASDQDMELTKKLSSAAKLLEMKVIEHLIITKYDYYSFADNGILR